MSEVRPVSGRQFEVRRGGAVARVGQVAAVLREFSVDGVHFTETWDDAWVPPMGCGIVLVPWPNRVADGRWTLDGHEQQLDLTEPKAGNAIHGLLRNAAYRVLDRTESSVTLGATVFPQHGYPFRLDTSVRYEVVAGGLSVTHSILNRSDVAAPVAVGAHPYLRLGDVPIEDLTLELHAGTWFETNDRQLPVAEHPVTGTDYDLSRPRRVGDLSLDTPFGQLQTDGGVARHRLVAPDGRWVELWQDAAFAYVQVFTAPAFVRDGRPGLAVAIEPMTAPPDALNSGQGLRWLQPDETWTLAWGIATGDTNG